MAEVVIKPLKDNFEKEKTQGNIDKTLVFCYHIFSVFSFGKMRNIITIPNEKIFFQISNEISNQSNFLGLRKDRK